MSSLPRVLFVSKPIAPPFHDGAKCLVRDVATHLRRATPTVLSTAAAPPLDGVGVDRIYPGPGSFAPALTDNARVMAHLLFGPRPDVWHFVFAPNPASSTAGRVAKRLRRVPTVQTVASAPRSFDAVGRLLFGDRIVTLSCWTRDRLLARGVDAAKVTVIPPSVELQAPPAEQAIAELRRAVVQVERDTPLAVYPGDIELSQGAPLLAAAVPRLLERCPELVVVFACRKKTQRAEQAEAELRAQLAPYARSVRFVGEVPSLPALLSTATFVAFPVDDLYGKVDLPIALLEAMALGVPIVALDGGPLVELGAALLTPPGDAAALADACALLARDASLRDELGQKSRGLASGKFHPDAAARAYEAVYDDSCRSGAC